MNKVLIVEDDQIVANIYRNKLAVEGYSVEIAADGEVGLQMVESFCPDVVLLDLMLPKLPGIDLMKKIRADSRFQQLPVIVFSNTYLTNMVQEAWKAGATKCLSKANCTPKQVLEVVRTSIGTNGSVPATGPAPAQPRPAADAKMPAAVSDVQFQAELRRSFAASVPATLAAARISLQNLTKAADDTARQTHLNDLYRRIHAMTGNAGIAGFEAISRVADALEALLKELYDQPKSINASTLRTVASGVDFIATLFERGPSPATDIASANILVVDDEAISRRAVNYAIEKARLKSVSAEDPLKAYDLLTHSRFDLVILDVDMPNMNGFELCSKLRTLPAYAKTPVVFVTSLTDFESRANSMMSGGNDFIAKPFLFVELAVKALVYVLRARLGPLPPKR